MSETNEKKTAVQMFFEAMTTVGLALVPTIEKLSTAVVETMVIKAKTEAQVVEIQGRVAIFAAQTELRRMELVAPIETEVLVAEAKVKLAKANKELAKLQEPAVVNGAGGDQKPRDVRV